MLVIKDMTDNQLRNALYPLQEEMFVGMSTEDLVRCVKQNHTIIYYLENPPIEVLAQTIIGHHSHLRFIVEEYGLTSELIKMVYREVGILPFFEYKTRKGFNDDDHKLLNEVLPQIEAQIKFENFVLFCANNELDANDKTIFKVWEIQYDEKNAIIDKVKEINDWYNWNLLRHMPPDYEPSVAHLTDATLAKSYEQIATDIIKKYGNRIDINQMKER
jgi:hypothetical protein